jgi:hypothetical protein
MALSIRDTANQKETGENQECTLHHSAWFKVQRFTVQRLLILPANFPTVNLPTVNR